MSGSSSLKESTVGVEKAQGIPAGLECSFILLRLRPE